MSYERPQISITLPRNFTFHYTDGASPKTPEPQQRPNQVDEPPKLRQPPYRVRRRRGPLPSYDVNANAPDVPVPSIETVEVRTGSTISNEERPEFVEGYLRPTPMISRFTTPPKTPVAQITPLLLLGDKTQHKFGAEDDVMSQAETISRPSSACSGFSDSSVYSTGSYGGSCTSPESDCADPFIQTSRPYQTPSSPTEGLQIPFERRKQLTRKAPKALFTEEMDRHLWLTYMNYLQDPTFTPFKMLPGVAPPLGVCHRVARAARKTWKGSRMPTRKRVSERSTESPDTIMTSKSGSTTPTPAAVHKACSGWPRENAQTRKRLRDLIKRKPSLSAHYARLVRCRTPSPFPSSPQTVNHDQSKPMMHSSFSRDMNISLATSTSATMQVGNPLLNLTSGNETTQASTDDWFGMPMSRPVMTHQKSQSLEFGILSDPNSGRGSQRSLRSPFHERGPLRGSRIRRPTCSTTSVEFSEQLHTPLPLPRSFRRRAQHRTTENTISHEPSTREAVLQELFGIPAEISHRRVRSRGFSLGDMGDGAMRLSSMFQPPPSENRSHTSLVAGSSANGLLAPQVLPTARLGSPFGGRSTNVHFNNTFPRNFIPRTFEEPASFEDRLAHME